MRNQAPPNSPTHVQSQADQVLLASAPIPREHHQPLLARRRGRRWGLEGCWGRSQDSLSPVEQAGRLQDTAQSIQPPSSHQNPLQRAGPLTPTLGPDDGKVSCSRVRCVGLTFLEHFCCNVTCLSPGTFLMTFSIRLKLEIMLDFYLWGFKSDSWLESNWWKKGKEAKLFITLWFHETIPSLTMPFSVYSPKTMSISLPQPFVPSVFSRSIHVFIHSFPLGPYKCSVFSSAQKCLM